jgi:hypothetical protein
VLLITASAFVSSYADDLPRGVVEVVHTLEHNRDLFKSVPMYLETISCEQKGPK